MPFLLCSTADFIFSGPQFLSTGGWELREGTDFLLSIKRQFTNVACLLAQGRRQCLEIMGFILLSGPVLCRPSQALNRMLAVVPVRLNFSWSHQFYFLSLHWKACRCAYHSWSFVVVVGWLLLLKRTAENKVVLRSTKPIYEEELSLWETTKIVFLQLPGDSNVIF